MEGVIEVNYDNLEKRMRANGADETTIDKLHFPNVLIQNSFRPYREWKNPKIKWRRINIFELLKLEETTGVHWALLLQMFKGNIKKPEHYGNLLTHAGSKVTAVRIEDNKVFRIWIDNTIAGRLVKWVD